MPTSGISKEIKHPQTLADALNQASELNTKSSRRGSSKQDAIDLTSDTTSDPEVLDVDMTAVPLHHPSLDKAIASSKFLQSLLVSGELGNLPGMLSFHSCLD
jgi:hypothetical protein